MRSYGQYCALARALDVVGERWSLLIIRELFAHDARYSDLREALPGIATNLLAERLRNLQEHGVVDTQEARAPVRATIYRLTSRGRELGPALAALAAWGAPLMASQEGDAFRAHWMALGLPTFFAGADVADLAPLEVLIRTGDAPVILAATDQGVSVTVDRSPSAGAVTVEGAPDQVVAFLTGSGSVEVDVSGPREAVERARELAGRATFSPRS